MIKLNQNKTDNCLATCFACLLNLETIPNILIQYCYEDLNIFLDPFGLFALPINVVSINKMPCQEHLDMFKGYYILIGDGGRGHNHAVIYKNASLFHDPILEGGGLIGPCLNENYFQAYFLVQKEINNDTEKITSTNTD